MSKTTIDLDKSVRDQLKRFKEENRLSNLSEAVALLLRGGPDEGEDDSGGGGAAAMDVGSDDHRGEERLPQLLSYAALAVEAKALKYHTGLTAPAQDWLMVALRTAV